MWQVCTYLPLNVVYWHGFQGFDDYSRDAVYENMPDSGHEDIGRMDRNHDMGEAMERVALFDSLPEKVKENKSFMHALRDSR